MDFPKISSPTYKFDWKPLKSLFLKSGQEDPVDTFVADIAEIRRQVFNLEVISMKQHDQLLELCMGLLSIYRGELQIIKEIRKTEYWENRLAEVVTAMNDVISLYQSIAFDSGINFRPRSQKEEYEVHRLISHAVFHRVMSKYYHEYHPFRLDSKTLKYKETVDLASHKAYQLARTWLEETNPLRLVAFHCYATFADLNSEGRKNILREAINFFKTKSDPPSSDLRDGILKIRAGFEDPESGDSSKEIAEIDSFLSRWPEN